MFSSLFNITPVIRRLYFAFVYCSLIYVRVSCIFTSRIVLFSVSCQFSQQPGDSIVLAKIGATVIVPCVVNQTYHLMT